MNSRSAYEAYVDYTNAHGGIDGHKIKLFTADDASDPGTSSAQVHTFVSQDHVEAIASVSNVDSAWATYVEKAHIPVVGADGSALQTYTQPDFFFPGQTDDSLPAAVALAAKKVGAQNFGLFYCAESTQCQQLVAPLKAVGAKYGLKVGYVTQISSSAPSYAAQCLAAEQAGVKALFIGDAVSVVEAVAADCNKQGYDPTIIASDGAVGEGFIKTGYAGDAMLAGLACGLEQIPSHLLRSITFDQAPSGAAGKPSQPPTASTSGSATRTARGNGVRWRTPTARGAFGSPGGSTSPASVPTTSIMSPPLSTDSDDEASTTRARHPCTLLLPCSDHWNWPTPVRRSAFVSDPDISSKCPDRGNGRSKGAHEGLCRGWAQRGVTLERGRAKCLGENVVEDDLGHSSAAIPMILEGTGRSSGEGRERPSFAQSGHEGIGVAIGARETQVQTTRCAHDTCGHIEEAVAQTLSPARAK